MASVRWDEKANLKFVSLYEKHSCLWKTDSPEYKNRELRERAISGVVRAMGMPDFRNMDCKNKIKNVRSHYIQELKKINKSGQLSRTGEPTYEPKLAWFAPLDRFLRPHILTLTRAGGVNQRNPSTTGGEGSEAEDSGAQDTTTSSSGWQGGSQVGPDDNDEEVADTAASRDPLAPNHTVPNYVYVNVDSDEGEMVDRKPKRMRAFEEPEASAVSPQALIHEGPKVSVTQDQKDTEFEAFGRSVAAQLKNMPFHVALKLQLKIQTLITEERLKIMSGSAN